MSTTNVLRCKDCKKHVRALKDGKEQAIVDIETTLESDTEYDPARHRSHWRTCKSIDRTTKDEQPNVGRNVNPLATLLGKITSMSSFNDIQDDR